MTKTKIIKIVISVLIAALTALGAAFGLSSCNVVRTLQCGADDHQQIGVLSERRHGRHDPDQDHRVLRRHGADLQHPAVKWNILG